MYNEVWGNKHYKFVSNRDFYYRDCMRGVKFVENKHYIGEFIAATVLVLTLVGLVCLPLFI